MNVWTGQALSGWLLFGESLSTTWCCGAVLIIAGLVLMNIDSSVTGTDIKQDWSHLMKMLLLNMFNHCELMHCWYEQNRTVQGDIVLVLCNSQWDWSTHLTRSWRQTYVTSSNYVALLHWLQGRQGCSPYFLWDFDSGLENVGLRTPTPTPGRNVWHTDCVLKDDLTENLTSSNKRCIIVYKKILTVNYR